MKKVVPLRGKKGKRIDERIRLKGKGIRKGISGKSSKKQGLRHLSLFPFNLDPVPFGKTFFAQNRSMIGNF